MPAIAAGGDETRRGIAFLVAGMMALATSDMFIKLLSGGYALHQIVFFRSVVAIVLTAMLVKAEGARFRTSRPGLHLARGLLLVVANMTFFTAFATLPLAEATALFFVAPIFITILSVPMLGERVGARRWTGVAVGMAGVLIVLRPGAEIFDPVALLPVIAAFAYALMQMFTRRLGVTDKAAVMSFYVHLSFLVFAGLFGLVAGDGRFAEGAGPNLSFLLREWIVPPPRDLGLLGLCGVLVAAGGYCLSQAYRIAEAAAIAPFEYSAMPLAAFWGLVIFGEAPDLVAVGGMILIVAGGCYIFLREQGRARAVAAERPTPRTR